MQGSDAASSGRRVLRMESPGKRRRGRTKGRLKDVTREDK